MAYQEKKNTIEWKVHFASTTEKVYKYLTTDNGRSKYWAEETKERNGFVEFKILNYPNYKSRIIEKKPHELFRLEYFGTDVTFKLKETSNNGTELFLKALTPNETVKNEMAAGWISVLMAMKGAVDFGIDLRNHDPKRVWENGYLDN